MLAGVESSSYKITKLREVRSYDSKVKGSGWTIQQYNSGLKVGWEEIEKMTCVEILFKGSPRWWFALSAVAQQQAARRKL